MSEVSPAEEVFFAALDRTTPAERAAYLDEACTGQPELRAQVEKLLAAHPRVAGFLESGAAGDVTGTDAGRQSATTDLPNHTPGTVVAGKYKLLQQIGEGGMGSVWMADQTEPVKRRVAVKLIRVERGTSKTILSRFEAERQAIALMDHPHIAKLLDAGTTDTGSPFFVMELVKGVPLTEYCDAHKLSIPDRLHLFMQICSAVQHAHQKGIIHRDLKPSNILVEIARRQAGAEGDRLRAGEGDERAATHRAHAVHRVRQRDGHAAVHGPGAGELQRRGRGHAGRRVRPRRDPVRTADRHHADHSRHASRRPRSTRC